MKADKSVDEKTLPKKVLQVYDMTYILPDDFEGDVTCALEDLTKFLRKAYAYGVPKRIGPAENEKRLDSKIAMSYGIFELVDPENKLYKLV